MEQLPTPQQNNLRKSIKVVDNKKIVRRHWNLLKSKFQSPHSVN